MPSSPFLSDAWLDQARALKARHAGTALDQPGLVVNATIAGMPFGEPELLLHSAHGPVVGWEPGHAPDPALTLSLDYALARELLLARDLSVLEQAADSGALRIDGDRAALRAWWSHRIANPEAVGLDDELRDLTA